MGAVLSIAKESFETDWRFASDYKMEDMYLKNECISDYIDEIKQWYHCIVCRKSKEIIAFLLYQLDGNKAEICN